MSGARGCALVTGGARRIGAQIARTLARDGYRVAIHASQRSRDDAQALRREIGADNGACVLIADLADAGAVADLLPQAARALGPVSLLVNNASLFEPDAASPFDASLFDRHMAVNLRAPLALSAALREGLAPGARAGIVNVLDQRVARLNPHYFTYTLSKSALWTATKTLAQSFAPHVRVNAVAPGPVLPNVNDGREAFEREAHATPLGEPVDPQEIADAVLYLARAQSVTGQTIFVDSGQRLAWRTPDVEAGRDHGA